MYSIDKEGLEQIIDKSCFSSDIEKNKIIRLALGKLISELTNYTNDVSKEMIDKCGISTFKGIISEIRVAFIACEEGNKNGANIGLFPMIDSKRHIFIDEDYEDIKKLIGDTSNQKIYQGQYIKNGQVNKFEYYLKFDNRYVERQELLYNYSLYYTIDNPVIFSPYSFKSFFLVYSNELKEEKLDFCFKDNGINAITSDKFELYWNNIVTIENRTYDSKVPYGDSIKFKYVFKKSKKGNYLLPLPQNNQTKVFSINISNNSIEIITDHDMDWFYILEPIDVDDSSSIVKALISNRQMYNNDNKYCHPINKRIISEADIEHAIAPFRENYNIKCCISKKGNNIVNRYTRKYKPNRNDKKLFNIISREYILFKPECEIRFLNDYINYVLEYLEYFYPEIEWVGEI